MKKPWFGRKKIGWGWGLPQTWQGWMLIIVFVALIILFRFISKTPLIFIILVLIDIVALFVIAWKTSGKPQWGIWWDSPTHKKVTTVLSILIIILVASILTTQFFLLQKAHSTFENYYAFRGCVQLLERTPDYGTCKLDSGKTIKIVKIQNKWYLDGDGPNVW